MTADVELLPCPFCGGTSTLTDKDSPICPVGHILCDDCYASADSTRWNQRATEPLKAEIEALRADVEAWKASHSLLTDTCHHFQARAKRLEESLRPTKEKLELVASVLGEAIAAHDEMLDEVGYSPFNRRRLDEAAIAVVELHATEVWS